LAQVDDIEDDWEILRRDPDAHAFPATLDMAEAIERICKAVVDFAILQADDSSRTKEEIEFGNKFPVFSILPFYDTGTKIRLWKVMIAYEQIELKYDSDKHDCCEKAVEQLFNDISKAILTKASEYANAAEESEREAHESKDRARKLRRLSTGMGSYNQTQPNLGLK
jgi:hypothetical protein